jgi:urease accessory protein
MLVIDRLFNPVGQEAYPIVGTVALTWEQRHKSRQKLFTSHGREVALALPTGTRLQAGDLLPTPEGLIRVECALEDVLLIQPRNPHETAFVAYQIGNRHLPLEIGEGGLKTLYEPVLETYLRQHAIPVERTQQPFTPVSAASGHHGAW